MPIERAIFRDSSWDVYWTAPGQRATQHLVPVAVFTGDQSTPGGVVQFDASGSDGAIVSYQWEFGDGSYPVKTDVPTVTHSYAKPGTYLVILVVADGAGNKAETSRSVSATVDVIPVAAFEVVVTDLSVTVDAGSSSDRDGQIVSYQWDFGDGAVADSVIANHEYEFGGHYEITLIVTDNQGATSISAQTIEAAFLPEAEFNPTSNGLVLTVDATPSYDFNPIVQYTWSWGYAGSTDTISKTPIAKHTFPADGDYPVTLTITDALGRQDFITHDIQVAKIIVPEPPLVQFSRTVSNLTVHVDASKTKDLDSWITEFAWDFGDGSTGSGETSKHTYDVGGTYTITLKATDNLGMHASTSHNVTVSIPVPILPPSNAGLVILEGQAMGMSERDIEIALMTALTESGLRMYANRNVPESLKYPHDAVGSDHDSLGIMQQRPSTGWGTVAQLMNAAYDAKAFYTALKRITDRNNISPWLAAQRVQISAYADGSNYKINWPKAQQMYNSLVHGGGSGGGGGGGGGGNGREYTPTYDNWNLRQIIAQDDYDPDISWQHHLQRGSSGGCDHNAPYGTPLYANCSGRVHTISLYAGGTGGRTLNLHLGNSGWYDQYMHLSAFAVSDGQYVKQGQLVGYSGASGDGRDYFYAPHFHLHRYTPNGVRVNAYHYFGYTGTSDSRNVRPQRIINTLYNGVPNATFYRRLQWFGKQYGGGYSFAYGCDGFMSIPSWKGVQAALRSYGYTGAIDGVQGPRTNKALQLMAHDHGATGSINGSLSGSDYKGISERLNLL